MKIFFFLKKKWYLNYDPNGKCYFYNAEGQSVWELPELLTDEEDDETNQQHFNKNFDDDLSTFKNLYTRLSTRQLTPQQQQQQQQTSQSYQHVDNNKVRDFNKKRRILFNYSHITL